MPLIAVCSLANEVNGVELKLFHKVENYVFGKLCVTKKQLIALCHRISTIFLWDFFP